MAATDAYCDTLKDTQKDFDDFESSDFSNFDQFTDRVDKLADEAPDEVKDDWKVLKDAFHGFVDALDKAGLKPEDLEGLSNGELPEGVDMEALTEAMTEAQALGGDGVREGHEGHREARQGRVQHRPRRLSDHRYDHDPHGLSRAVPGRPWGSRR